MSAETTTQETAGEQAARMPPTEAPSKPPANEWLRRGEELIRRNTHLSDLHEAKLSVK